MNFYALQFPFRLYSTQTTSKSMGISQYNGISPGFTEYIYGKENDLCCSKEFTIKKEKGTTVSSWSSCKHVITDFLLPKGMPTSVEPQYLSYMKWQMLSGTFSAVSGVLSTQALLYALGLGAGSIPMAAAINWVIKDGFGQFGGVIFAGLVNNRFDADPRRWRMLAGCALDISTFLEILTPFFSAIFLPMASIANIGKNVAFLAGSASRAGIHLSLAKKNNLADVTAKAGSQITIASVVGMAIGVTLSPFLNGSPLALVLTFAFSSSIHLSCLYYSLRHINIKSLSPQRSHMIMNEYMKAQQIPSVEYINQKEKFLRAAVVGYSSLSPNVEIVSNQCFSNLAMSPEEFDLIKKILSQEKYLLHLKNESKRKSEIYVLMDKSADDKDCIKAHYHALNIQQSLETGNTKDALTVIKETYENIQAVQPLSFNSFFQKLKSSQWNTRNVLLDDINRRYWIHEA